MHLPSGMKQCNQVHHRKLEREDRRALIMSTGQGRPSLRQEDHPHGTGRHTNLTAMKDAGRPGDGCANETSKWLKQCRYVAYSARRPILVSDVSLAIDACTSIPRTWNAYCLWVGKSKQNNAIRQMHGMAKMKHKDTLCLLP